MPWRSWVRPAAARARSCTSSGALEAPSVGTRDARRQRPVSAGGAGTGGVSQQVHRVRLPGSFASPAVLGSGERARADPGRTASGAERDGGGVACACAPHPGGSRRSTGPPPGGTFRGREATCRAGARADPQPGAAPVRRAHGQSRSVAADAVASLLLDLHAARQTMLVVVTHSAALAERFPRRYEMNGGTLR